MPLRRRVRHLRNWTHFNSNCRSGGELRAVLVTQFFSFKQSSKINGSTQHNYWVWCERRFFFLWVKVYLLLSLEMGVMEGRVIPADRRGSCCFLLGIVTVTFHGASHAGITKKEMSCQFWKNIPFSGAEGFDLGVFFSNWLLFWGLKSWIGFSENELEILRRDSASSWHLHVH